MAAQTEGRDPGRVGSEAIPVRASQALDVAASTTIYGGSLVFVNSSGYATATSPDQTMSCAGYAESDVDNSAGAAGALTIIPRIGAIKLANSGGGDAISADDVGKMAYAADNQTAALTSNSGTRSAIGPILGMDGTQVVVLAGFPLNRELASFTAVSSAPVFTSQSTTAFSAEVNIGALTGGILAHTVAGGVSTPVGARTLQAPAAGLTISNPAGAAGDPTFALANDLAALEAMAGTGLVARTGAETYAQRSIAVAGAGLSVANGDGVAGNPTLSLGDGVQALEALAGTGLVAHTAADAYTERSIASGGDGISIANGNGVAGNPTISLANDLAALEALDATAGLLAKTGAETYARRTLTAPAAGITVSNGDGAAGNPTLALANDLAAYEGLAANGIVARTGDGTASARTITAGSTGLSVTNGDGVAGNPTVDNLFAPIQVADPGTGVAIPVTRSATISMTVGAGAETNTAAIPTFDGQELRLYCAAIGGGTRAITFASAINVAGNTIATFNAARDYLVVHAVRVGGVLAWEVAINSNVVLS